MKILLINQYFPPDTSATAFVAARAVDAMTAAGHAVTVLAGRPSYDPTDVTPWRPMATDHRGSARVVRVGSTSFARSRVSGRAANYLSYGALALPVALVRRADVVVTMTDPPLAPMIAAAADAIRTRPLVYWMQDVHPAAALAAGMLSNGRVARSWDVAHRWAARAADHLVVLGDDMRDRVEALGVAPEHVHVVRTGADLGPPPPDRGTAITTATARAIRAGDRFVAVHAGNLGHVGAWDALITAARGLGSQESLVFVGSGSERARLERQAAGASTVRFCDFAPAAQVRDALVAADLHIVTVRRGLEGLVVPSKLYGVLAAGRPILAVCDERSDVARLVLRHRCGMVADPDVPDEIASRLEWAGGHPDELEVMGQRARGAAVEYDQAGMMENLVKIVELAALTRAGRGTNEIGRGVRVRTRRPSR